MSVTEGAGCGIPVPVRATSWGLFEAESTKCRFADRELVAVGVNCTETVQLAFAASTDPQLFTKLKSPGLLPVSDTAIPDRDAVPVLVRVSVIGAELTVTA